MLFPSSSCLGVFVVRLVTCLAILFLLPRFPLGSRLLWLLCFPLLHRLDVEIRAHLLKPLPPPPPFCYPPNPRGKGAKSGGSYPLICHVSLLANPPVS
ncbi:hypothetical protein GGS23DRAFT_543475 [Durotheca rogersii]|uniref:uncharacterized protein n=1 Tax=Durotheca rogersii TaxID=419775 RepID=UPI00221F0B08|nr:uncharacterized protein GGS23DRAFT_543475 [Durotheca rogersii]KAI5867983.1 hypothetical protein GGS23DRAFT_543475 [Durotheca rogersii]